jgi:PleD family two-component response regulator
MRGTVLNRSLQRHFILVDLWKKQKYFIVDDETITALYIQECLENLGYNVVESAISGYDAIDIAEESPPGSRFNGYKTWWGN